ncbi:hypothetical protein M0813_28692 [Anaeramoeba flamelloides]|uniref:Uncharacterized protein n=1 Tax=Anaeramoeba flamelloides TaxID=1746091 RepID=A0ABQ8XRU2_9EUKA|nr:hypothetical protein M0813_28692 [Anaeramoeba flamelloides]
MAEPAKHMLNRDKLKHIKSFKSKERQTAQLRELNSANKDKALSGRLTCRTLKLSTVISATENIRYPQQKTMPSKILIAKNFKQNKRRHLKSR